MTNKVLRLSYGRICYVCRLTRYIQNTIHTIHTIPHRLVFHRPPPLPFAFSPNHRAPGNCSIHIFASFALPVVNFRGILTAAAHLCVMKNRCDRVRALFCQVGCANPILIVDNSKSEHVGIHVMILLAHCWQNNPYGMRKSKPTIRKMIMTSKSISAHNGNNIHI